MTSLYSKEIFSSLPVLCVFFRLLGLFLLVPGFSHAAIPGRVKILLAMSMAFAFFPMLRPYLGTTPTAVGDLALAALRESLIGLFMGFIAYVTFEAIHLAGQFVGYQLGFGTAGLIDPHTQTHVSVLVPVHAWLILMVFFATDFHHLLLNHFIESYRATRPLLENLEIGKGLLSLIVGVTGRLFILAIQMAAPFTALVLLINAGLGILTRLIPQMNGLLFTFPITVLTGLFCFYLFAPEFTEYLEERLGDIVQDLSVLLTTI